MEMRKRILMSSAFMILISLAALLSVGGVAFIPYWNGSRDRKSSPWTVTALQWEKF